MRIDVAWDRCEGHGACGDRAPEMFSLTDDGELVYALDGQDVPEELHDAAFSAATVCPVAALTVTKEP